MLSRLVSGSLRYPWIVVTCATLIVASGVQTLLRSNFDVFPEFVPPQAEIQVEAAGLGPEEVERLVTRPLESAINGSANVERVRSESIQGLSAIKVTFFSGTDLYRNRQILAERLAEVTSSLPAGVNAPVLAPMTSSTMDLLKIGFTSHTMNGMELRSFVDGSIRPRLLAVPGVARAIVYGGGRREIQVQVDPVKLVAVNSSLADVVSAARAASGIHAGGFLDTPNERLLIEYVEAAPSPETIGGVVLTQAEGANVRLRDVATVTYASEPAFGDAHLQAEPDVLVSLGSQYGANTLAVTRDVESVLSVLQPMLAESGVTMSTTLHRPANFIEIALRNVRSALLLGGVLVAALLLLFLRNWRMAAVSFVTIPLSFLVAVIVLERIGLSLNTMTLGGLAVAIGVVVDDAVIDVENIVRRLRERGYGQRRRDLVGVILDASLEVRRPIVLATAIVGLVFVPILFLPGLQGSFFAPLAAAFLLATAASLLVALTVTPALALLLLRATEAVAREPRWLRQLKAGQRRVFRWSRRYTTGLTAAALLLGLLGAIALSRFALELMPDFREGHFVAQLSGPPGVSLQEMTRVGDRVTQEMLKIPGVATVSLQVGRAEASEDTWAPNRGELHIELQPDLPGDQQTRIEGDLRKTLAGFPGYQSEVVTFLGDRISESVTGETAAVSINVFGTDLSDLDATAKAIAARLRALPGAADIQFESGIDVPTLTVAPDARKLSVLGIRPAEVLDAVNTAFSGNVVSHVHEGNLSLAVRVILDNESRGDAGGLKSLPLKSAAGRFVPLSALAAVTLESSRGRISHERGQRRQLITLNPHAPDVGVFVRDAEAAIARDVKLPQGVHVEFEGNAQAAAAASRELLLHTAFAAAAIVALLLFAFGDFRGVLLVMVNAPFSMVGGVVAIALTGGVMSMGTLVGLVTLFGISARNSIMLLAHYEHLVIAEGRPWSALLARRGTRERLTPILMTALVTGLGVLPLALGSGNAGKEVEGPMAVVILGGLVSSTVLNLMLLPAIAARFFRPRRPPVVG